MTGKVEEQHGGNPGNGLAATQTGSDADPGTTNHADHLGKDEIAQAELAMETRVWLGRKGSHVFGILAQEREFHHVSETFPPRVRSASVHETFEATQVAASGRLNLPITATCKPSQIKEAIEHYQRGGKVLLDFNE
jgi:hypothetical protein